MARRGPLDPWDARPPRSRSRGWSPGWGPRSRAEGWAEREEEARRGKRKLPPAKFGQRWWRRSPGRETFVGVVPGFTVPVSERGRIIGDRGRNVRRLVEVMCDVLGHQEGEHGRAPFVQFNETSAGTVEFELELYEPFNNEESFRNASRALREMVLEMRDPAFDPQSRHCSRPSQIQPDDWDCPNPTCGNLCFSRRKVCPLCGAEKPRDWTTANTRNNVPDSSADPELPRPPKHRMEIVPTKERLGPPAAGELQVVWLVPLARRGGAIGRQGATIRLIKEESGADFILTKEVETRRYEGETYCLAFLRGKPPCTKRAVRMLWEHAGGRLGEDGFEDLLQVVEAELNWAARQRLNLSDLTGAPAVRRRMAGARELMQGAGLRSLMEVLEQWPERFKVQRTGPAGAAAELLGGGRRRASSAGGGAARGGEW